MHDDPFFQDDHQTYLIHDDELSPRARGANKAPVGRTVYPVEPRKGPWSGNNQLGITQDFLPDTNNRQTIMKMDEWGQTSVRTVMLGLEYNEDAVSDPAALEVQAYIEMGAGGTTQTVVMDWHNGVTFSAPMNAINIIAQYQTAVNVEDMGLRLTAIIGAGRVSSAPPTFTPQRVIIPAGTDALIDIPNFARELVVNERDLGGLVTSAYDPTIAYELRSIALSEIIATQPGDQVLALGGKFQIPNGARTLRVVNSSAQQAIPSLLFNLDL